MFSVELRKRIRARQEAIHLGYGELAEVIEASADLAHYLGERANGILLLVDRLDAVQRALRRDRLYEALDILAAEVLPLLERLESKDV